MTAESQTSPELVIEEPQVADPEIIVQETENELDREEKRRKRLLLLLLFLLILLFCSCGLFIKYIRERKPLPELLQVPVNINYAPHYLFSIYGLDEPVGVGVTPEGDRVYVAETGGERLIKVFDREGNLLSSFAPPRTGSAERSPVYVAIDNTGRVFVSDRLQHAVYLYDREGNYLDTLLTPELTLSEYVASHVGGIPAGSSVAFNGYQMEVYYQLSGEAEMTLPAPSYYQWAPLGIRIDHEGNLLMTDVTEERNTVRVFSSQFISAATWQDFDPPEVLLGSTGQGNGQLLYPNVAVSDSSGRIFVTDGNNGRISVWDDQGNFLFNFGRGTGESGLNLPRGAVIDDQDRLYVVDAVGQNIKVYDVSANEPVFLYEFGDWGVDDGLFNYPNDIAIDNTGRLYIADRENNRIQVWSY
jgi:tripartite motif-containing protein 71